MGNVKDVRWVIRNRPVAIVFPGPSVVLLKDYISQLAPLNICWAGTNKFWVIEDHILRPAGIEIEILWHGCAHHEADQVKEYLARETDNILLSPSHGQEAFARAGIPANKKMVAYNCTHYNSLSIFLICLKSLKVRKVFLFGADGKASKQGVIHYGQELLEDKEKFDWYIDPETLAKNLDKATSIVNRDFVDWCYLAGCTFPTDIINVTDDSAITIFRKINLASAVEELKALEG